MSVAALDILRAERIEEGHESVLATYDRAIAALENA